MFKMKIKILTVYFACVFQFKEALAEECMPTFVDCYCENYFQRFVQIAVNTALKTDNDTGITFCVSTEYPPDVCAERNCVLMPNENFANLFGKGRKINLDLDDDKNFLNKNTNKKFRSNYTGGFFRKRRFTNQLLDTIASQDFPVEIVIPAGGTHKDKVKRSFGDSCDIPTLENSEVTCWKWPNWITCNQECINGYGIDTKKGTILKTSMNCRFTENKWKPHNIRDCKPYLNCKAHLKSPGELNCVQLTKKPSYCEIKCDEYDDESATELKKYICDEKFTIPHCAILDDSVSLIAPPAS